MISTTTPLATIVVRGHPVSIHDMYGSRARGGRYLSDDACAWKMAIRDESVFAWRSLRMAAFARQSLQLSITFFGYPGKVSNAMPLVLNGLREGIGLDTWHYQHVKAIKDVRAGFHGVEIHIWGTPIIDTELEAAVTRGMEKGLARTIGAAS